MATIRHTTSSNANFGPLGAAAWDADHAVSISLADVTSLPEELAALSAAHQSLVDRVSANSGTGGGGGSVTSLELNAVSVAAQSGINTVSNALSAAIVDRVSADGVLSAAVTTVSNAVSAETVNRVSADGALSVRLDSVVNRVSANSGVGGGGSVTSAEVVDAVSVEAANRTSADGVLSAAVTTVSNAVSAEIVNRTSADGVLSAAITTVSNAVSAEIANRISAVNVVSQALSALSNANSAAHVSIDGRVTSVANAVSVLSQALSALSNANSAAHVSIDGRVTSVFNAVSALSQTNSVDHAALSARLDSVVNRVSGNSGVGGGGSVTSAEVFNAISSLADRVSANSGTGGAGSVTSNELSAAAFGLSTRLDSVFVVVNNLSGNADSIAANLSDLRSDHGVLSDKASNLLSGLIALSGRVDTLSAAVGAVSNYASVASNAASVAANAASVASNAASVAVQAASVASAAAAAVSPPQIRIVSNVQSVAGSALVDISGLVLTVAADQTWEIMGMLAFSTSATTVGLRAGYSVPPLSTPRFGAFTRFSGGQSAGFAGGAGQLQVSGASIFMSITGAGPAGGVYVVNFQHVMNVASAGTVRLMYAGIASTTASPIHLMPGSYLKAIRLK